MANNEIQSKVWKNSLLEMKHVDKEKHVYILTLVCKFRKYYLRKSVPCPLSCLYEYVTLGRVSYLSLQVATGSQCSWNILPVSLCRSPCAMFKHISLQNTPYYRVITRVLDFVFNQVNTTSLALQFFTLFSN